MKSFYILLLLLSSTAGFSCDVCGAANGTFGQGVLPEFRAHYLGSRYNYSTFFLKYTHTGTNEASEKIKDLYNRVDLFGRYNLNPRMNINLSLPYWINSQHNEMSSGIGDPVAQFNYRFLNQDSIFEGPTLFLGGGIKFPFGAFQQQDSVLTTNQNYQFGSGSFDFLVTSGFFYQKNRTAWSAETMYKLNTPNNLNYRFGNQLNISLNLMYLANKNSWNLVSLAGIFFEDSQAHFQNTNRVFNTGGQALFGNLGVQIYRSKMRFSMGFQYPLYQKFQTDNLTEILAGYRLNADLIFFLSGKQSKSD